MGILEGLKRTFNIGGAKIEIFTDGEQFAQGGEITGRILIKCGDYDISCTSIRIFLEEYWQESRGSGKNRHTVTVRQPRDSVIFQRQFTLQADMEYTYQFTLKLPLNARLSTGSTGWSLLLNIDVPNAIDPEKRIMVNIVPSKELLALSKACQDGLNFREKPNSWRWDKANQTTCFRLLPPEDLTKEFDYIEFELYQMEDGSASGTVTFNLQEKFFKDYFKALVGQDRIACQFSVNREELYKPDGSSRIDAVVQKLRIPMGKIISDRDPYSKTY